MLTLHRASELQPVYAGVLVPTMGALHAGHATLIRRARQLADTSGERPRPPVVVTIFVNPTQFNDPADLARYPRTPEADLALCREAGADAVFMPEPDEVYPPAGGGGAPPRVPKLPPQATDPGLEDALRPGHFAGVCQVVLRLFDLTRPRTACFGEKDWQQLCVIAAMVEHEGLAIRIEPVQTVREADGLAMSSRNRFLSPSDRVRAIAVPDALQAARRASTVADAEAAMRRELESAGLAIEYATIRDSLSLMPPPRAQAQRQPPPPPSAHRRPLRPHPPHRQRADLTGSPSGNAGGRNA